MKFSIIVTGFNAEKYVSECIDSILAQTYTDYELIICDDASTDSTQSFVSNYLGMNNPSNNGALYCRYHSVEYLVKGEIMVFVGMDDYLQPNALEVLAKVYEDPKIKLSYGSWMTPERVGYFAQPYPQEVFDNKSFRTHKWLATSPNSFKRELLLKVPREKLIDPVTNEFYTNCTDLAYSFPCLEMCKSDEVAVVKEFIYVYRNDHDNTTLNRLGKENKTRVRNTLKTIETL